MCVSSDRNHPATNLRIRLIASIASCSEPKILVSAEKRDCQSFALLRSFKAKTNLVWCVSSSATKTRRKSPREGQTHRNRQSPLRVHHGNNGLNPKIFRVGLEVSQHVECAIPTANYGNGTSLKTSVISVKSASACSTAYARIHLSISDNRRMAAPSFFHC